SRDPRRAGKARRRAALRVTPMIRNYLAAALQNLARNKFYAAVNVLGLAIGFATAILIALFIRDEFSYDHIIPGNDRIYLVQSDQSAPGRSHFYSDHSPTAFARQLKLDFPQVEAAARVFTDTTAGVRHGDNEHVEKIFWADPNFFEIVQLP